ncbi:Sec20-domain-containing protein [Lenzites betulinus]|nr:Sec20-domain-containing protein [Lenzites betulinus]
MPPLPSSLDEESSNLISSLERRQKDLAGFQIPRLRQCTGPLSQQQQYAAELRDDLDVFSTQLETLDIAVEDQRTERARRELRQIVEEFKTTLASLRKDMRAAVLASKRAIDSQQVSRREELLRSSAVSEKQTLNEKVTEDALMKANNDVTEALHRTIGLMQGELERSVLSTQLLESSTAALKSTSTTHDVLSSLMSTSKHLITALEKSDWLDRLVVLAALAFFVLVVLFILKQRLVDRGLRIALWWTRFVPDFSGDDALLAMEKGDAVLSATGSSVVAAVSTVVASASTVVASLASSALSSESSALTETAFAESPTIPAVATLSPLVDTVLTSQVLPTPSDPEVPPEVTSGQHDEL